MEELRKWIDVATRVRATCQNVREFDRLQLGQGGPNAFEPAAANENVPRERTG
jgi:hypothetical protein